MNSKVNFNQIIKSFDLKNIEIHLLSPKINHFKKKDISKITKIENLSREHSVKNCKKFIQKKNDNKLTEDFGNNIDNIKNTYDILLDTPLMENYNIKEYITRTDEYQMKKKLYLRLRKYKNFQKPLSLCLINRKNNNFGKEYKKSKIKLHNSNIENSNIENIINNENKLFTKKKPPNIRINISKINHKKSISLGYLKLGQQNIDKMNNRKNKIYINEQLDNTRKLIEKKNNTQINLVHSLFTKIFEQKREEINRKKMFKNLQTDIRKNQLKVKEILDDLIRTRHNNDEDLKRKGFIIRSIKNKLNLDLMNN